MRNILDVIKRSRFAIIGVMLVCGTTAASIGAIMQAGTAAAATTCPQTPAADAKTNILFCGISGNTTSELVTSFKSYYNANSDAHTGNPGPNHTDLQTVYNFAGASQAMVNGMSTSNTIMATSHSDGTITRDDNGQVIGTNMQIAGRFVQPNTSGFTHVVNDVWIRSFSVFFARTSTVPTLVHLGSNGAADFAVWIPCGNVLKFTPKAPQPPTLTCTLTATALDKDNLSFRFMVQANTQNISSATFNFGDNSQQQTVHGTQVDHTFTQTNDTQNLTVTATVTNGSSTANCQTPVVIPPQQNQNQPGTLACTVTATPKDSAQTNFSFTANASATNSAQISSFVFDFGDNSQPTTITTSDTSATTQHQFDTTQAATRTVSVTVNGEQGVTSQPCTTSVTITLPPTTTTTSTPPQVQGASTTQQLPNTGPGSILGIFTIAALAGGTFYQFVLRKKLHAY